jgi:transposase
MSLEVQKMSDTNKPKQPKFTLEFKQDAARLVIDKGYSHQQAADSLGVSLSALGRWVRAERNANASPSDTKPALSLAERDELARLRKETERLRMEREILKKAVAFFAKDLG